MLMKAWSDQSRAGRDLVLAVHFAVRRSDGQPSHGEGPQADPGARHNRLAIANGATTECG